MAGGNTASARPMKLSLNKGLIRAWDPDTNTTEDFKWWEGWILDYQYESNAHHPDERFRKPELQLRIHDGEREAILSLRLMSGSFRQFAAAIENANLRQPVTFRPWASKNKKNEDVTGGINLWQGNVQVQPKYSKKNPNGMPLIEERENKVTMEVEKDGTAQMAFLRTIIDGYFKTTLEEVKALGAWEEAPKVIGPIVPGSRKEEQTSAAIAALGPATTDAARPAGAPPSGDEDDLPF